MADMLSLLAPAVSTASGIYELIKTIHNPELSKKMAELNRQLAEAMNDGANLMNENRELKAQIQRLMDDTQHPLTRRNRLYYADGDADPFCPRCYEVERIRVHLTIPLMAAVNPLKCPNCKQRFHL
jgi:hypothetical protein